MIVTPQTQLDARIRQVWADHFKVSVDDLSQDGTSVILNDAQRGSNRIDIWAIERRAFLRIDPDLREQIASFIGTCAETETIQAADLVLAWQDEGASLQDTTDICYLHSDWFSPASVQLSFTCREMKVEDKPYLDQLQSVCTDIDLKASDIEIDNEAVFGCFHEGKLVAVASMYTIWGGFADIGVLTHPEYRGRGLGKMVVSALTERLLEDNQIVLYRYSTINLGSAAIARSLGFRKYYEQQSVKFI